MGILGGVYGGNEHGNHVAWPAVPTPTVNVGETRVRPSA